MANNYARGVPVGKNNIGFTQEAPPPYVAIIRQVSENATASSVLSLSSITTAIEVAAIGAPAFVKWITTGDTSASVVATAAAPNYDHVVPSGTMRRFVVPMERTPLNDPIASVQGVNLQLGLYGRVAVKSVGIASVLVTEY